MNDDFRQVERLDKKLGCWKPVHFTELKTDDIFRMFESDGASVVGVNDETEFVATSKPFITSAGVPGIKTRMKRVYIAYPFSYIMQRGLDEVDHICSEIKRVLPISPSHLFSNQISKYHFMISDMEEVLKQIMLMCDEVWVYGSVEKSEAEVRWAEENEKRIVLKTQ